MLRSAALFAPWCAAEPGSMSTRKYGSRLCGAARRGAAPRPGHVLPSATPRLSFSQIQHRPRRHDAAGIYVAMAFVVMMLDVKQIHGLRNQRLPIKFFQIAL